MNKAILIDNVVVSTNFQGCIRATPIKLLKNRGLDYSDVPQRTYGSRAVNNAMIGSILDGQVTIDNALNLGQAV